MKISIILTSYLTLDGSLRDHPRSSVFFSFPSYSSAVNEMHDLMHRYNRLGFQVFPFLGGISVYSHGNPYVSYKFADYED